MANITINILPDSVQPRVVDALCTKFSYNLKKIGNESKGAFAKRMIAELVKAVVIEVEAKAAADAASVSAATDAASLDIS